MERTLIPNPDYKPETSEDKKVFEEIKKHGPVKDVPYVTAMENIRQSKGMYAFQGEVKTDAPAPIDLERMSTDDLKLLMAQFGVKTEKQMKRTEVIKSIRLKMAEITIADE